MQAIKRRFDYFIELSFDEKDPANADQRIGCFADDHMKMLGWEWSGNSAFYIETPEGKQLRFAEFKLNFARVNPIRPMPGLTESNPEAVDTYILDCFQEMVDQRFRHRINKFQWKCYRIEKIESVVEMATINFPSAAVNK